MQQTLVLVKPDGVRKNLIGEIISRFERRGLKVSALKLVKMTDAQAKFHYAEHEGTRWNPYRAPSAATLHCPSVKTSFTAATAKNPLNAKSTTSSNPKKFTKIKLTDCSQRRAAA